MLYYFSEFPSLRVKDTALSPHHELLKLVPGSFSVLISICSTAGSLLSGHTSHPAVSNHLGFTSATLHLWALCLVHSSTRYLHNLLPHLLQIFIYLLDKGLPWPEDLKHNPLLSISYFYLVIILIKLIIYLFISIFCLILLKYKLLETWEHRFFFSGYSLFYL
jgi:hypothetical protein